MNMRQRGDSRSDLYGFVSSRVQRMQSAYLSGNASTGARQLAVLRRAAMQAPGAYAPAWPLEFEGLPESLAGREARNPVPSQGEWAVHLALTLYASHQQSQRVAMHVQGADHRIGAAVRVLVRANPDKYGNLEAGELPRRFAALVSAQSIEEIGHYLRQIVGLLRGSSIPLDYGRLAQDVFDLQNPYRADGVRLTWGRDYAKSAVAERPIEMTD